MTFKLSILCAVGTLLVGLTSAANVAAQQVAHSSIRRPQAAAEQPYTFLVFYKQNDGATQAMASALQEALATRADQATVKYVQVGDPAQQALVEKYDVARAPMPLTVVLAPNGAITGMFAQQATPERVEAAFVTPTMMFTMKSLQEGKLVLVSAHGSANSPAPPAIEELQGDPEFQGRVVSVTMQVSDPQEAKFTQQMKLDPQATETRTVVIAPPGVMVGQFKANASKEAIVTALAKAGRCCDDPNCKRKQ